VYLRLAGLEYQVVYGDQVLELIACGNPKPVASVSVRLVLSSEQLKH